MFIFSRYPCCCPRCGVRCTIFPSHSHRCYSSTERSIQSSTRWGKTCWPVCPNNSSQWVIVFIRLCAHYKFQSNNNIAVPVAIKHKYCGVLFIYDQHVETEHSLTARLACRVVAVYYVAFSAAEHNIRLRTNRFQVYRSSARKYRLVGVSREIVKRNEKWLRNLMRNGVHGVTIRIGTTPVCFIDLNTCFSIVSARFSHATVWNPSYVMNLKNVFRTRA